MIELVIVMIIIIIIASFAIYSGTESVNKAEATEVYLEISNIKKAVSGVIVNKDLSGGDEEWLKDYYDESNGNDWYTIYGMDDSRYSASHVKEKLSMDMIKRSYVVNYKTGEVMLREPVKMFGNSVRTYESIRGAVESDKI